MREPTNTTAEILTLNGSKIAIKARPDDSDNNPSGWSIIAFAPSASIRCVRAHQPKHFDLFIKSVMALGESTSEELYREIEEVTHNVTMGAFR